MQAASRSRKKQGIDPPLGLPEGRQHVDNLDFNPVRLLTSRTVEQQICVVLIHFICGNLLQQL